MKAHYLANRCLRIYFLLAFLLRPTAAFADEGVSSQPVNKMGEVLVTAKSGEKVMGAALPDVQGAKIYAGKKTSSVQMKDAPQVANNFYRQAFSQLPALLVSEQNNQGHVNINYRGIGDPHESQDLLTLKDGLPIGMERYGYSTTYYNPPFEAVEKIELVRGGSALLYGPQPGPVLNYVTYDPPAGKAFSAETQHLFGSHDFYSTYNMLGGTSGRFGYLGYFHHSQGDGQRNNEDFEIYGGSLKLTLDADKDMRWIYTFDAHEKESGEPGRLTLAQYQADPDQTIRPSDRLEIERYAMSLGFERDFSEDTLWTATLYGSYFERFSLRRTSNTSNQNNLDTREVTSGGFETRLRHHYAAFGDTSTFTGGAMIYGSDAPRSQDRSAVYPSREGTGVFDFDYHTLSGAVFAENLFRFGDFFVSPAFRLEVIEMDVRENFNTGKTSPLHDIEETYVVPLFGAGAGYRLLQVHELYANASQGFKPPQFDNLAPTGNNTLPATELDEGKTWTYEAGLRGAPFSWMHYDVSAFLTEYENYFGTVSVGAFSQTQNVGDAEFQGVELSGEADLIGLFDALSAGEKKLAGTLGSLSLYGNASFLDAEFTGGPLTGKEPAFAPNHIFKAGVIWRFLENRAKISVMGTFVEDHYWADNNLAGSTGLTAIPSYEVWDLNSEFLVYKDNVTVFFNVANLADEEYFSRVRPDGIEPALGREFYGGFKVSW